MTKKFQRTVEDFTCAHCGQKTRGSGYTNHCPKCLWSKHVDINPGDRLNPCQGLMKPAEIDSKHGQQVIVHVCQKCGQIKRNKVAPSDDFDIIVRIAAENQITRS